MKPGTKNNIPDFYIPLYFCSFMKEFLIQNTRNEEWHLKHKLPADPTTDQIIKWHMEHARRCPCTCFDKDIAGELIKRYSGTHQDFWIYYNTIDHRALGFWAADCAERILPYFESNYPGDRRPVEAIKILRKWAETGKFNMSEIRKASLGAHAAAKEVKDKNKAAELAAHAAGQAVGTAHVPTHAFGVIVYSVKLIAFQNPLEIRKNVLKEREWQNNRLPENLRPWADARMKKLQQLLPKNIRMEFI